LPIFLKVLELCVQTSFLVASESYCYYVVFFDGLSKLIVNFHLTSAAEALGCTGDGKEYILS